MNARNIKSEMNKQYKSPLTIKVVSRIVPIAPAQTAVGFVLSVRLGISFERLWILRCGSASTR